MSTTPASATVVAEFPKTTMLENLAVRADGSVPMGPPQLERLRKEEIPMRGNRVDLGFNSDSDAMQFGRRPVTVYVLHP